MGTAMMVLFPLTFVSSVLPRPRDDAGRAAGVRRGHPVSLLVEAARGLMDGGADGGDIGMVLVLAVVVTAVFSPIAMRLYNRAS